MPFVPFVPFASAVALEVLLPIWLAWEVVVEINCSASAAALEVLLLVWLAWEIVVEVQCGSVTVDPPLAQLSRISCNYLKRLIKIT